MPISSVSFVVPFDRGRRWRRLVWPETAACATEPVLRTFRYKAFISYSTAADGRLAPALQAGLHGFAKPWYRLRAMRVFRDKTGLSVTPKLWGAIERALRDSEYFILLASPAAAGSKWVQQEVEWWLHHRSASHALIVWTDGHLVWDPAATDFDWKTTTALPPAFSRAFRAEPLYLDLRWARTDNDLSLRRPRFAEAVARLSATLNERPLDEMIGEDVTQHRTTIRWLQFAAIILLGTTFAALFAAYLAVQARNLAVRIDRRQDAGAARRTNEAVSRRIAAESLQAHASDPSLAILLAAEAVRIQPTAQAVSALRHALSTTLEPVLTLPAGTNDLSCARFSPDGTKVLTWGDSVPRLHDAVSGRLVREFRGHTGAVEYAFFTADGSRLCTAATDDTVRLWDTASGRTLVEFHHPGVQAALPSPDGTRLLSVASDAEARLWDVRGGPPLAELPYADNTLFFDHIRDACFQPDGSQVAVCLRTDPVIVDAASGRIAFRLEGHPGDVHSVAYSPDGVWLVTTGGDATVRKWRAATGEGFVLVSRGDEFMDARFTADGTRLIVRERAPVVLLLDAEDGREIGRLDLRPAPEHQVLFSVSPAGGCVAVASFDRPTTGVWDSGAGLRCADLTAEGGEIRTVEFSPDGRRVVVGNFDAPARIYACDGCGPVEDLVSLAKRRAKRDFTEAERARFGLEESHGP